MKKTIVFSIIFVLLLITASCGGAKSPDYLVLVNKEVKMDPDYVKTIELVDVKTYDDGSLKLEKGTYEAYKKLHDALLEEGVEIGVDSGYRSIEKQQSIMDEFIEKYGEEYAKKTVAIPGTSEHHTGLAVDIVVKVNGTWIVENEDMIKETETFEKIHARLADFGFILRYPEGKDNVTGYAYEPWHLRFVGTSEQAKKIYDSGLTLEEYLK